MKAISDVLLLALIATIPYVLAWSRLSGARAKEVLYQAARNNPGIRG